MNKQSFDKLFVPGVHPEITTLKSYNIYVILMRIY